MSEARAVGLEFGIGHISDAAIWLCEKAKIHGYVFCMFNAVELEATSETTPEEIVNDYFVKRSIERKETLAVTIVKEKEDAAAKAIYRVTKAKTDPKWDHLTSEARGSFRHVARAVITAIDAYEGLLKETDRGNRQGNTQKQETS